VTDINVWDEFAKLCVNVLFLVKGAESEAAAASTNKAGIVPVSKLPRKSTSELRSQTRSVP
jgi:hypothetical protein